MTFFQYKQQVTEYQHLVGSNSYPLRFSGNVASKGKNSGSYILNGLIIHQRTYQKVAPCVVSINLKMRKGKGVSL